jgi:endonuclease/exonuclease/phosphatase family metal-dependent hydrolase
VEARKESSKLILAKIKMIAGNTPVIFMGDLNGGHESEWYKLMATSGIMHDAYSLVENKYVNNGSFNGWGSRVTETDIIDHIFVSKDFTPTRYGILTDTYKGKYPSDHFPVMVEVKR